MHVCRALAVILAVHCWHVETATFMGTVPLRRATGSRRAAQRSLHPASQQHAGQGAALVEQVVRGSAEVPVGDGKNTRAVGFLRGSSAASAGSSIRASAQAGCQSRSRLVNLRLPERHNQEVLCGAAVVSIGAPVRRERNAVA
jgi:hypothetical protein